jgi:hypothetical protein
MGTNEASTLAALRPRLTMAGPLLYGSGEVHIVGRHDVVTIHDPEGAVHRLLGLADGSRTRSEIFTAMTRDFPRLGQADVDEAVAELEAMGLLQDATPRGRILSSRIARRGADERRDPDELSLLAGPRTL